MTNSVLRQPASANINGTAAAATAHNIDRPSFDSLREPPGASKLQLELWRRVLSHRCEELKALTPVNFQLLVGIIAQDLKKTRFKEIDGGEKIDLAKGYCSSHLIYQYPPPSFITAGDVACHMIALFYRSIDERLSGYERKYGLDAVKRVFSALEKTLKDQINESISAQRENQARRRSNIESGQERDNRSTVTESHPNNSEGKQSRKDNIDASQKQPGSSGNAQGKQAAHDMNANSSKEGGGNILQKNPVTSASDKSQSSQKFPSRNKNVSSSSKEGEENNLQKKRDMQGPSSQKLSGHNKDASSCSKERKGNNLQKKPGTLSPSKKQKTSSPNSPGSFCQPTLSLPPPTPNTSMRPISFLPDCHAPNLASGSLHPRNSCTLYYDAGFHKDGTGATLNNKEFLSVRERLERWDPYWKIVREFGQLEVPAAGGKRRTKVSTRTTSCTPAVKSNIANLPVSGAVVSVDLPRECRKDKMLANHNPWGLKWGETNSTNKTGDRRLLLRMLPLKRTKYDQKRSDTHIWPIGTFLQLNRGAKQQVLLITQRRQQNHDPKLWKGLCYPLDMTQHLPDSSSPFSINICTKEVIETPQHKIGTPVSKDFEDDDGEMRPFSGEVKSYDGEYYKIVYEDGDAEELNYEEVSSILVKKGDAAAEEGKSLYGSYAIHLAVCEYTAPDDLHDQLIENMQKISLDESKKLANQYLKNMMVSIDDSDCEGSDSDNISSSLTFSLLCPVSKLPIGVPVRGRECKHMQCFDLKSFLHSNRHVAGGRWRCAVCEDFLSVKDLICCGLFEAMLREYRDKVSGARDKVSFRPDGTWCLKAENKLRYASKRSGSGVSNRGGGTSGETQSESGGTGTGQKRPAAQPEIIDLL